MRKFYSGIFVGICILFCALNSKAQVSNYGFAASAGTYTPITGTNIFSGAWDDGTPVTVPIGFTFNFNGVGYTSVSVNPNGYITFGSTTSSGSTYTAISSTTGYAGAVAAWSRDLQSQNTAPLGSVDYNSAGGVFTVQWSNARRYNSTTVNTERIDMQIRLIQATNEIKIVYGTWSDAISATTTNIGEVGLRGAGNTDFKNLSVASGGNWASPTPGAVNSATVFYNETSPTTKPASGLTYTFTPPPPCVAPTAQPTALNLVPHVSSFDGSFTNASPAPTGYLVVRTTTNTAPVPVNGTVYTTGPNAIGYIESVGTATSFTSSGLNASTQYYYWVFSFNNTVCAGGPIYLTSAPLTSSGTTTGCSTLSGIKTVGPTGDYLTLTAANTALTTGGISGPVVLELQPAYTSGGETYPLVLGNVSCASATNTITIRPASGATALTISSANATATLDLNSAIYVTVDGRPGGTGTAKELSIINTSATGVAIRLINDAHHNTITYSDVQGQNTSATSSALSGVIYFSTASASSLSGNDNNTISFSNIHGTAAGNPAIGISSFGSVSTDESYNDNGNISNCNIYDFFSAGSASTGVKLDAGNNAWTLTGNSVYQTATRTYTATNTHRGFWITPNTASISTTASGFIVTDNYIGGSAPLAGGSAYTMAGAFANVFNAMDLSVGLGTPTSVQNNTIKNFSISTTSGAGFIGISQANGHVNIGTVTGNTIGATTGVDNIKVTTTATGGGVVIGYRASGGTGAIVNIANNNFGSVTTAGTATLGVSITGINITGAATINLTNNTIGSTSTANSINASASTTGNTQSVTGISVTTGTTTTVSGNTIANLNNNYTGTGAGLVRGIVVTNSATSIANNTIRNLSNSSQTTGTGASCAIVGIAMTSTNAAGSNVTGNTIHSLSLTSALLTPVTQVTGIFYNGTSSANSNISRNFIHSFDVTVANTNVTMTGIDFASATATIANNMIRLGIRPDGSSLSTEMVIRGISSNSSSNLNNIFFNSIYIGGSGVGTSAKSTYAFIRTSTSGTYDIRNNIFVNNRSNATTGGKHYALFFTTATTGVAIDYNIYNATGTGGVFAFNGTADVPTYTSGWIAGDIHSFYIDPLFVLPTGSASTLNLHLQTGTIAEGTGINIPAITDDFDGDLRTSMTPTDIGADAGNYGLNAPDVGINALVSPAANGCYTATQPVIVRLKNFSANAIDFSVNNVTVNVNATGTVSYSSSLVLTSGTLAPGATMDITMPATINMSANGSYVFNANAIVAGDLNGFNNALVPETRNVSSLTGTLTVGVGGDFTTLTAAAAAYNAATCLNGNVIFSLTDASYPSETFPVTFTANTFNGTNTLTIRPAAGINPVISGSNATALISFSGSKNVIIDGSNNGTTSRNLTISNTNTSGAVIRFINSANTNTVKNTVLNGVTTSTSNGVVFFSTVTGTDGNNNNIIQNNVITKGSTSPMYGIFNSGTTTTTATKNTGNQFIGNKISDFTNTGIRDDGGSAAALYSGNEIFENVVQTTSLTGFRPSSTTIEGFSFTGNWIHDLKTTSTGFVYGIHLFDAAFTPVNLVANNMIAISETAPLTVRGIYDQTNVAESYNVYYNTISLSGVVTGASTSESYYRAVASITDLKNNILSNTRTGGTGKHYAIRTTTPLNTMTSNYNDIYSSGGTANVFGNDGTADRANLAAWQTATSKDANSISFLPSFVSAIDLHLIPGLNIGLNDQGTPITGITTDFDGQTRNASTPDMGADEFTPPAGVDVIASTLVTPVIKACYSNAEAVSVSIKNFSTNTIDFSVSPVTVNLNVTGGTTANFNTVLNSGTLAPGDSLIVNFTGTINMTATGNYVFNAAATTPGDINTGNDAMATVTRSVVAVNAGTVTANQTQLCYSGTPSLTVTGTAGGSIQWQESANAGGPWTNVGTNSTTYTPAAPITANMYYQVVVSCNANTATSNTLQVVVNTPQLLTTTPGSRCGIGTVTLSATGSAGTSLNWYTTATGGAPVATGNSFTTPVIGSTTNYYVAASNGGSSTTMGKSSSPGTDGNYNGLTTGLVFDATSAFTLNSVQVYPIGTGTGSISIELKNSAGTVLATTTASVLGTANGVLTTVPLGFSILPGTGYRLELSAISGLTGLLRDFTGVSFPYAVPGVASITGGWISGASTTYYFFYNWSVSTGCESPRLAVAATVTPPPAITVLPASVAICSGQSATILVNSSNTGYTYNWNPGSLTGSSISVSPTATTKYIVTATDASGGANNGCVNKDSITVTVNALPGATVITPASPSVCPGGIQQLTASSSVSNTMNFGTQANQNVANTGATGYPSPYTNYYGGNKHQFLILASELTAAGYAAGSQLTSLQFPVVSLGSTVTTLQNFKVSLGHTTASSLTTTFLTGLTQVSAPATFTPAVGFNNTHNFTTPFVWDGTSNIVIETTYSNANTGGTTDLVVMYNSPTSFQSTNVYRVDGASAATVAAVTTGNFVYSARPDFKLNGTTQANITWSPVTNLFTDALASTAYTGGNAAVVYSKPTATITYTATATNSAGCSTSATRTVTVLQPTAITTQPVSVIACTTNPVTFTVVATGTGLTYQWRKNNTDIVGATSASYTIPSVAIADAGNYTVVVTGTCGTPITSNIAVLTIGDNSWVGISNSDWNNPLNWCGGIPTPTTNVLIPSGTPFAPVIASNANANNVQVNSGATLTITASGRLSLYGNLLNSGTFNSTAGSIEFRGTTNQSVPAITAAYVYLNGTGGVTLGGNMNIGTALTLTNGNITLGNNNLVMTGGAVGSVASHIITNGTGSVTNNNVNAASVVFPVSPDATSYNPVMIANGQGRNYTVKVATGINPAILNSARAVNRTWNITANTAPITPVSITLQYADADANGTPTANMEVGVHNGTNWITVSAAGGIPPTGTASARLVAYQTISFGPTVLANIGGLNFPTAVGNVDADVTSVLLMPNIVEDKTVLRVQARRTMKIEWQVIDANGRIVLSFSNQVFAGKNDIQLRLGKLASGSYHLSGSTGKGTTGIVRFIRL